MKFFRTAYNRAAYNIQNNSRPIVLFQKQPPKMLYKKSVLENFLKFTGNHLCQSFFFNKVAGLRPATLLKYRLYLRCFPCEFSDIFRNTFFTFVLLEGYLQDWKKDWAG